MRSKLLNLLNSISRLSSTSSLGIFLAVLFLFSFSSPALASTISVSGTSTNQANTLNQGLVGYWTMDAKDINWTNNTIIDRSGNGNTGTLISLGKATSTAVGKIGQGLNFSNKTSKNYISATSNLFTGFPQLSYCLWIKPVSNSNSLQYFLFQTGNGYYARRNAADGSISTAISTTNNGFSFTNANGGTAPLNKWTHFCFTYSSGDARTFSNGTMLDSKNTLTGNVSSFPTSPLNIGGWVASGTNDFQGIIDDVRIYNRVLSPTEIQQLYNQSQAKYNYSPTLAVTAGGASTTATSTFTGLNQGLVGYWTMDAKDINWTNNTIADRSGYGNTGTLVGLTKATSTSGGKVGQAIKFDGVRSLINTSPSNTFVKVVNQPLTISIWFNTPTSSDMRLASLSKDGNSTALGLTISAKKLAYLSNGLSHPTGQNVALNKWTHFVATFNGSCFQSFINGLPSGACNADSLAATDNTPFRIAAATNGTVSYTGFIDDVRIYNRALSPVEVQQLYNQSMGQFNVTPAATSTAATQNSLNQGLVGYWTMDAKDIDWKKGQIIDRSGNNNTGSLFGMSTTTSPTQGKVGQALKFDGVGSYVQGLSPKLNSSSLTLSYWVRPSKLIDYEGVEKNPSFRLNLISNGGVSCALNTSDQGWGFCAQSVPGLVKINTWSHIVLTYVPGRYSYYVNGVPAGTFTNFTGRLNDIAGNLNIGFDYGTTHYQGLIDDVRLYNCALSAQEIKQLYNLGR